MISSVDQQSITLLSNVRSDKKNSPSSFITTLAHPLNLVGQWEVALEYVSYYHEWFNLHQDYQFAILMPNKTTEPAREATPAGGVPDSPPQISLPDPTNVQATVTTSINKIESVDATPVNPGLEAELQSSSIRDYWKYKIDTIRSGDFPEYSRVPLKVGDGLLKLYRFIHGDTPPKAVGDFLQFDYHRYRTSLFSTTTNFSILAPSDASILHVLGFGKKTTKFKSSTGIDYEWLHLKKDEASMIEADSPIQVRSISSIFIYSDIVCDSLIGDVQGAFLGFIPVQTKYGDQGNWYFSGEGSYVPVKCQEISSIKIELRQDTGELLPTSEGKTVLKLRFRRKKTLQ